MIRRILILLVISAIGLSAQTVGGYDILVVNDDGYETEGIRELAKAMQRLGKVTVVAPKTNASGVGHGITYKRAIEYKLADSIGDIPVYWVDALPSTCVRWAIDTLYADDKPDVVVSGINRGVNVGYGVYYSGTVGAAREAAFAGVPAIAASTDLSQGADYKGAAEAVARICAEQLASRRFFFLNINFPSADIVESTPVRFTHLTKARYHYEYVDRKSPRDGQPYFWIKSENKAVAEEGTDQWAIHKGFISVTPLKVEVTDWNRLEALKQAQVEKQRQEEERSNKTIWPK